MADSNQDLITASEIARHLFCARALAFDRLDPSSRRRGFWAVLRNGLFSPLRIGLLVLIFLALAAVVGILYALVISATSIIMLFLMNLVWRKLLFPSSVVIYHGTKARCNGKMLVTRNFGLSGKPDCILEHEGYPIPILRKSSPSPDRPHQAHIMQLIAHCLLIAENHERHPAYGVIQYGDGRTFEVDFDEDAVEALSQIMDEIEENRTQEDVAINHDDRGRCYACQHRKRCNQSLFN